MDAIIKNRVAIYARVSTAEQTTENQVLDLESFCLARRWTIKEIFRETMSGAKDERPELKRMMALIRRRQFDSLLVWRLDRFARNIRHLVNVLDELREIGVDFVSYRENIDTSTSQGRLMFHVFAGMAEFERELIRERIFSGLRRARADGKRFGRPPAMSDEMAGDIRRRRAAGQSIRAIAAYTHISKSVVQRALSQNPPPDVAMGLDGERVAL